MVTFDFPDKPAVRNNLHSLAKCQFQNGLSFVKDKKSRLNLRLCPEDHSFMKLSVLLNIEMKFSYWNIDVKSIATTPDYNRL